MSTVGLEPTTLEEAGALMASSLGLSWPKDRSQIVEYINDFRDILYNSYGELNLFDNVFHCICVSTFPMSCGGPCDSRDCFQGFTLPDDMMGVEAAWQYNTPLKTRSRWREAHVGLNSFNSPQVEITEMAELTCTQRALQQTSGLKIFAENVEDGGKEVFMDVVDGQGVNRRFKFTLDGDGWMVLNHPVRHIESISLPAGRKGNLILAQTDGYELSHYGPHETVPTYKRFRVNRQTSGSRILVQGTKRFRPIAFDHDVVEVGSRSVLKAAGSFLRYREGSTEAKDLRRSEYDRTEMGAYLLGLHKRSTANAIQDGSPFRGRRINRSHVLPGYENS